MRKSKFEGFEGPVKVTASLVLTEEVDRIKAVIVHSRSNTRTDKDPQVNEHRTVQEQIRETAEKTADWFSNQTAKVEERLMRNAGRPRGWQSAKTKDVPDGDDIIRPSAGRAKPFTGPLSPEPPKPDGS